MSTLPKSSPPHREIRQHNALTTARYEMTACEMDIVFALISMIRKDDRPGTVYSFHIQDLNALSGREWNYQRLMQSASKLRGREYHFEDEHKIIQAGVLASSVYLKGDGTLELEISERMRPYLIDLKSNFTSYHLHSVFKLTSKYAKRIYQICSQWKDIGETKPYTIDEFKIMLSLKDPKGIEPEQYAKFSTLKKYVLDIAVAQINEHTDLQIEYNLTKKGRSYDKIRFYVRTQKTDNQPIALEEGESEVRKQNAMIHLENLGIVDPKLVKEILGDTKIVDALFKFLYNVKTGKKKVTDNPAGLFLTIVGLNKPKERPK
jgi:plasmid replication initiation protein